MRYVSIREAKTKLSRLVRTVESGEEVVIMRNGKPVVKLVRVIESPAPRRPGMWAGRVEVAPGCFDPLGENELATFDSDV